jgi:hypothetical protein
MASHGPQGKHQKRNQLHRHPGEPETILDLTRPHGVQPDPAPGLRRHQGVRLEPFSTESRSVGTTTSGACPLVQLVEFLVHPAPTVAPHTRAREKDELT